MSRRKMPPLKRYRVKISRPGFPDGDYVLSGIVPGDASHEATTDYMAKHNIDLFDAGPVMDVQVEQIS